MEKKENKSNKPFRADSEENNISAQKKREETEDKAFPGYPHYPASEDIYNQEKEVDLNPEDLTKVKPQEKPGKQNEKDFCEDMTGEDLDVPGSKADEAKGNSGSEDEENNYYSLGGDDHNDLEEDKGG